VLHFPYDPAAIYATFQHKDYATFADWQQEAIAATNRLAAWIAAHPNPAKGESLPVENGLYQALKGCLKDYFHGKCAYCESDFESVSWGDVEHYRPKRKVTDAMHPGYYWLAYEPSNLMPSCERCNRADGKLNKFPIAATGKRAFTQADSLPAEVPLLLNPYDPNHCGTAAHHLKYVIERDGLVLLPTGRIEGLTPEGRESIDTYKLNRTALVNRRRQNQDAAITKLSDTYKTPAFLPAMTRLLAQEQEHAAAVRAACVEWLQLQQEQLGQAVLLAQQAAGLGGASAP
jgi:hypothetical protein